MISRIFRELSVFVKSFLLLMPFLGVVLRFERKYWKQGYIFPRLFRLQYMPGNKGVI